MARHIHIWTRSGLVACGIEPTTPAQFTTIGRAAQATCPGCREAMQEFIKIDPMIGIKKFKLREIYQRNVFANVRMHRKILRRTMRRKNFKALTQHELNVLYAIGLEASCVYMGWYSQATKKASRSSQ